MNAVRPVIASNAIPYLKMRSVRSQHVRKEEGRNERRKEFRNFGLTISRIGPENFFSCFSSLISMSLINNILTALFYCFINWIK